MGCLLERYIKTISRVLLLFLIPLRLRTASTTRSVQSMALDFKCFHISPLWKWQKNVRMRVKTIEDSCFGFPSSRNIETLVWWTVKGTLSIFRVTFWKAFLILTFTSSEVMGRVLNTKFLIYPHKKRPSVLNSERYWWSVMGPSLPIHKSGNFLCREFLTTRLKSAEAPYKCNHIFCSSFKGIFTRIFQKSVFRTFFPSRCLSKKELPIILSPIIPYVNNSPVLAIDGDVHSRCKDIL